MGGVKMESFGLLQARLGPFVFALVAAALLTVEHVIAPAHRGLSERPRHPLLSFAGGAGTAFVLLRLLPQVASGGPGIERALAGGPLRVLVRPAFSVTVLSLLVFYALLRLMQRQKQARERGGRRTGTGWFWLHAPIYALLNVVIGMLVLQQAETGWQAVLLFVTAKGSALLVLDHAFFDQHGGQYDRIGRWMTAMAIPSGVVLRLWVVPLTSAAVTLMLAVLGGAVILNMIGEEVPPERDSRIWAFALGAVAYAILVSAMPTRA